MHIADPIEPAFLQKTLLRSPNLIVKLAWKKFLERMEGARQISPTLAVLAGVISALRMLASIQTIRFGEMIFPCMLHQPPVKCVYTRYN